MCSWSSNTHKECAADFFFFFFSKAPLSFPPPPTPPTPPPPLFFSLSLSTITPITLITTSIGILPHEGQQFIESRRYHGLRTRPPPPTPSKKKKDRRRKRREKSAAALCSSSPHFMICFVHSRLHGENGFWARNYAEKKKKRIFSFAKGIIWDSSARVARLGFHNTGTIKVKLIYLDGFCTAVSIWHECALNTEYWSSYLLSRKRQKCNGFFFLFFFFFRVCKKKTKQIK